jgi:hypothetical protein
MDKYIRHTLIIALFLISTFTSCGSETGTEKPEKKDPYETGIEEKSKEKEIITPLVLSDIQGVWELKYGTGYGYNFRFYKNFKSLIVLYLKKSSIVFKGVYTLEETNSVRVNIIEMKFAGSSKAIFSPAGFTKTKQSYFIFKGHQKERDGKKIFVMKPEKIFIDGKSSHGYFEPRIKLKLKKKYK